MPVKFRCPHCLKTLIADDDTVGQPKPCPACGRIMHVPQKIDEAGPGRAAPRTCPRCKTEAAPNATFCHRCFTIFATGKPMPWRDRLPHLTWRFWATTAFGSIVLILVIATAVRLARVHWQTPPRTTPLATQAIATDYSQAATALLAARSADERHAGLAALAGVERSAVVTVAAALDRSLDDNDATLEARRSQRAAIELIVRNRDAAPAQHVALLETLKHCEKAEALRDDALRARALLDDDGALDALIDAWLPTLERAVFFERVAQLSPIARTPGAALCVSAARRNADRLADGLRRLGKDEDSPVFARVAGRAWDTWGWLGQTNASEIAGELFSLARPADASLQFDPAEVRRPRDVMRRVAETAAPAARGMAALALSNVPQYRSLSERIAETLCRVSREADALDQQRLTWVVTYVRGKRLTTRELNGPLDVTAAEVSAAQRAVDAAAAPVVRANYAVPPALTYRAVTPRRQLAAELAGAFEQDWPVASDALERWSAAGLGLTPKLRGLLNPGQREPHYPGVACALVIAGVTADASVRTELELWRDAADQPDWVRALAGTVLARLDQSQGRNPDAWPGKLVFGPVAALDAGTPGWEYFGRVIASAGNVLRDRLAGPAGQSLSKDVRKRLLDATQRVVERTPTHPAP